MLLEALSYPFPVDVACVGSGWVVCCRWGFLYFFFFSLYFSKNYSLVFCVVGISTSKIIAWSSKTLSSCGRRPTHYGLCVRHLLIYKNSFLPCCWKHHRIFLLLVWRVSVVVGWIVVNEAFFSFLLFSLLLKKNTVWFSLLLVFQLLKLHLGPQKSCCLVGGAHALSVMHATPSNIQKFPSTMLLEASSYLSPVGVARVGSGWVVCCWWGFLYFFLLFSLFLRKLQLGLFCCWYFNFNSYSFEF